MQQVFQEFPHAKSAQNLANRAAFSTDFLAAIDPMRFGNLKMDVPEGQMKIAQRFNAGTYVRPDQVPKGRLINGANRFAFNRPFGTQILRTSFPALKRQATLAMSLRDNRSRSEWARTKNNSNKNRARRGARTGPAPGPTAGGCRAGSAYSLRHVCSRAFEKPGRKR